MKESLNNIKNGIILGIANLIPGLSSASIAEFLGIYAHIIKVIEEIFSFKFKPKNKQSIKYLLELLLGMLTGFFLFAQIIRFLLVYCYDPTVLFIIGLIIGTIPILLRSASEYKVKYQDILICLITFLIIVFLPNAHALSQTQEIITKISLFKYIYLFFCGIISALVIIMPGVSVAFILVLLGCYHILLFGITTFHLPILIIFMLGFILGLFFCNRVIEFLLNKFFIITYYIILGLVLGSIIKIWPGFSFTFVSITGILCLILGAIISFKLGSETVAR
jgi:putative membrane protein